MSGSYGIDPVTGDFTIEYNSRVTTTTGGTLICLVQTLQTYNATVEFVDPPKDIAYVYDVAKERSTQSVGGTITYGVQSVQTCQSFFTRTPYEQTVEQTLATAPLGADIFVGQLRFNRTISPTHTWYNSALDVKQKQNEWIPWNGSAIVEASVGLVRGVHLFIKPNANPALAGTLVLQNQQSVMGKSGGYVDSPNIYVWPNSGSSRRDYSVLYTTTPGLPVWTSTDSPYRKSRQERNTTTNPPLPYPAPNTIYFDYDKGRNNQCSQTDPTNYRSVYSVDVRGWFGKRSIAT